MKLACMPLLAVHHIGFLPHRLLGLISVCVSVEVLYFHQDLEQKSTKQKSCKKNFKIVLVLAYGRMPRKLQGELRTPSMALKMLSVVSL